ncbi:hypothetical protein SOVF_211280 [Spinacia oleracea]|uniref:F-box protein At3g07870 n=1 Tax=Spinacia oleracea TaxID=3562 RepID=A0A9R0KDQ8_SPIOL|nr:F-box protein At3g07870-like [Spinacia oleracea]XP_056698214.1 F-box protein At3g07870-like [Spinacia oleracea]KNA03218.1 hypothetical protein SOVF_211280 [Spinacia oleracea]
MSLSLQRYNAFPDQNSRLLQLLKLRSKNERERSKMISMEAGVGADLPESLIIEILSWLPVKDLLQLKSVCKSWYAIILNPHFVSKHLNNYYYSNINNIWRSCLLAQYQFTYASLVLCEFLVDDETHNHPRVLEYGDDVLTTMSSMRGSNICGPCDGLYYLFYYHDNRRALWNHAINEFKPLPELIFKPDLPSTITYAPYEVFGFGLDPVTKDYKVVVIKGYWSKTPDEDGCYFVRHPWSVLVYSLWTDSWRYCGDLARDYELDINNCYMYVNGCCYWLGIYPGFDSSKDVIISFDMATNEFKEIVVPDYVKPSERCLAIYDGSLALLSLHKTLKILEIWTFGIREGSSWIKQHTMGPFPHIWNPLGHWKDNCILLESTAGELVLIDPITHELKNIVGSVFHGLSCRGVFAYMESLVSFKDKINPELLLEDDNYQ